MSIYNRGYTSYPSVFEDFAAPNGLNMYLASNGLWSTIHSEKLKIALIGICTISTFHNYRSTFRQCPIGIGFVSLYCRPFLK